jgi:hypothetical protein
MIGGSGGETPEMSLSHHSWRSPHDAPPMIADSARKPTEHDGFRTNSMITHPWRRSGHYPHTRARHRGYSSSRTAATSMSSVWMHFGRSAERDRGQRRAGLVSWARRSRLGPDGLGRSSRGLGCVDLARVVPAPCGGGRVGGTTESRGCVESRPRLGGTPVSDETVPAGCHATGCGPVSLTAATQIAQDRREWDMSCTHAVYVTYPLIKRLSTRPALALISRHLSEVTMRQEERDHRQSRGHPAVTVSSRTGVPPSRGRPSKQPRGSVVLPTRPPSPRAGSWRAGGPPGRPGRCARQSDPGRERRANPASHDQVDPGHRLDHQHCGTRCCLASPGVPGHGPAGPTRQP